MEADHVRFVRRQFTVFADRTGMLRRLCVELTPGPSPLSERVAALSLASADIDDRDDVLDPAGRDADVYDKVVDELWELCQSLITRL